MKKLVLTLCMVVGLFVSAQAAMIHLGDTIGQPADVRSETIRLEALLNGSNLGLSLPSVTGLTGVQTPIENGSSSINLNLSGFTGYILFKWGNQDCFYYIDDNGVPDFTTHYAWTDQGGTYTFQSDNFNRHAWEANSSLMSLAFASSYNPPAGLSHYTVWAVPEAPTWWAGGCLLLPFALSTYRKLPFVSKV